MLLLFFIFFFQASLAFGWDGSVDKIHDGDTITVRQAPNGQAVKIRLWGVDCPEYRQAHGKEATEFVRELLPVGTIVQVEDKDRDRYRRNVSLVSLPDGRIVQEELLRAGLAWVYWRHCQGCDSWGALEESARKERRGLWSDTAPVPPWEWRGSRKQWAD